MDELNTRDFEQHTGARRSAYLDEEKAYMLPLPAVPFEATVWSVAKVPNDYLISDVRNKYSVPYNLIGKKVDIWGVASHRRLQIPQRGPLVKLEHMPEAHQKYLTYNANDSRSRLCLSIL